MLLAFHSFGIWNSNLEKLRIISIMSIAEVWQTLSKLLKYFMQQISILLFLKQGHWIGKKKKKTLEMAH